ncbi:hypothetical protein [Candidatus Uabimicrobium amorphum]|uniref:Uncharacterized protein n=1 Tax=Uabimicrobium amorphum TaxID=2596890 RepID=A0A5S9ILS3_UABAM|nr:hypothetical protein [Candidatus Uabimicrobium amorphum]BBM82915.1 hypothetical protein UABAM_01258 [Candidatus Uabimicrobium amorphum]
MIKYMCLMILFLGIVISQDFENTQQQQQEQQQEQATPEEEQGPAGIDLFYANRGFDLTPKTQALQWTNRVSTVFYYDSNVFLNEGEDRADDFVWATQLQSDLRYVQESWQIGLTGIFRYEDYLEENSLDQFLPRGSIDFSYKGRNFYASFKSEVSRNTVPNTVELNDRSPWNQSTSKSAIGFQYKQLIFEVQSFHSFLDFEDIEGDYHNYGQAYVLKYRPRQNVTFLFETAWDYINYREAAIVAGDQQSDTLGVKILPGVEIAFTESLYVLLQVGLDHRTSFDYVGLKAFLVWQPSPNLRMTLSLLRQTLPTFAGDFQLISVVGAGTEYLLTENTVIKTNFSLLHGNPENGATSYLYTSGVNVVYRLFDGVEFEAFCSLSVKDDSIADFVWLKTGGGINVVF